MTPSSEANITCLCGAVSERGSLLVNESLPTGRDICHCNPCRRTTGAFFLATYRLRTSPSERSLAACAAYASSKKLTRYFCATCGTHCFGDLHEEANGWFVCTGAIELGPASSLATDTFLPTWQEFVADTGDCVLAVRMHDVGGLPAYWEGSDEPEMQAMVLRNPLVSRTGEETLSDSSGALLPASCHCGALSFALRRLPVDWAEPRFPDAAKAKADHRQRFYACFCACRSCRLALGATSLMPWLYVPPDFICQPDGTAAEFDTSTLQPQRLTGLRHYESTRGEVVRSFCASCGACAFYWARDSPRLVNVAAGLLKDPSGSCATAWVEWDWDFLSRREECADEKLARSFLRF